MGPTRVIGKRPEELGYAAGTCTDRALLHRARAVRALINQAQMDGRHVRFDDPAELAPVVGQAQREAAAHPGDQPRADDRGVLSLRRG